MPEQFDINDDGCFSYLGDMTEKEAVKYFNHMMEAGVWLDPDCALERKDWSFSDKCNMRNKLQHAFDLRHPIYGKLAFGIICQDRITGQFGQEPDFRSD